MVYAPKSTVEAWREVVAVLAEGIPVSFLLGLLDRLSSGNENYEGRQGGRGLYQIHPNTAERLGIDPASLWEPENNISIAIDLLRERGREISSIDPAMATERAGDLGLLTTASYLWGPGIILPQIRPGVTAAEVFAVLDPDVGEFALDVFARAQAYENGDGAIVPSNGVPPVEPPTEKPSILGPLLWIVGITGVALGVWVLVKEQ